MADYDNDNDSDMSSPEAARFQQQLLYSLTGDKPSSADDDFKNLLVHYMHAQNQKLGDDASIGAVLDRVNPGRVEALTQSGAALDPSLTDPNIRSAHSNLMQLLSAYGRK